MRTELTWADIAREFLQEHWQKLLLCLGVLLIVVSSTAGAHHVLGPLLWRPEGKCLLALIYTLMFAAFGMGLTRWGATSAGRMVLLATLSVVPVNFALAGELRMLASPAVPRLLMLLIAAITLLVASYYTVRLIDRGSPGLLPAAFFALGAANALVSPGMPSAGGLLFWVVPGPVYLAAVWGAYRRPSARERSEGGMLLALGLLTYVYVFGALRSDLFVLNLDPALHALPAMLVAVAALYVQRRPWVARDPGGRVEVLRLIGFLLVGGAFALLLAGHAEPSALTSANRFVTALLGAGLFVATLQATRRPGYLYLTLAALLIAGSGARYFLAGLFAASEATVCRLLGYDSLPAPFRAMYGLEVSLALAALALRFEMRWRDDRLARHCQGMALLISLCAAGGSCFEPVAAALTLTACALAYAAAAVIFLQPLLLYLTGAAVTGAAWFSSTLPPELTTDARALAAASLGLLFGWIARGAARRDEAHARPLRRVALALAGTAIFAAMLTLLPGLPVNLPQVLSFSLVAALLVLLCADTPHPGLAVSAVAAGGIAVALAALGLDRHFHLGWRPPHSAVLCGLAGATSVALGASLRRLGARAPGPGERPGVATLYADPLVGLALVFTGLDAFLGVVSWAGSLAPPVAGGCALAALAMALAGWTLGRLASADRRAEWAFLSVGAWAGAFGAAATAASLGLRVSSLPATVAVAVSLLSLGLHLLGAWLASEEVDAAAARPGSPSMVSMGTASLYRDPCLYAALAAVAVTWLLCAGAPGSAWLNTFSLSVATGTLVASGRFFPRLAHLSLVGALAAWLSLCRAALAGPHPYPSLLLIFTLVLLAGAAALRGWNEQARIDRPLSQLYEAALPDFATVLLCAALVLTAVLLPPRGLLVVTLLLSVIGAIWLTLFRRETALVYLGLMSAVAATHAAIAPWSAGRAPEMVLVQMAPIHALLALGCWGATTLCRRFGDREFYGTPCLHLSGLLALGVLSSGAAATAVLDHPAWMAAALAASGLTLLLLARDWRWPACTYAAMGALAAAAHLTLFAATRGAAPLAAHGTLAAAEAVVTWGIGLLIRQSGLQDALPLYGCPIALCSPLLTLAAVPLSLFSPAALSLTALALLLQVRCFPSAAWLYPALGLGALAVVELIPPLSEEGGILLSLSAAYGLWGAGVLVGRFRGRLCARLQVEERGYELPLFHAALCSATGVLVLRGAGSLLGTQPWTAHAWVTAGLSGLSLLMLKPFPSRGWVHLTVALLNLGLLQAAFPLLEKAGMANDLATWLVTGMALVLLWRMVQSDAAGREGALCRRFRVNGDRYSEVPGGWSLVLFVASAAVLGAGVVATTLGAVFVGPRALIPTAGWPGVGIALLLAAAYVWLQAPALGDAGLRIGLHALVVLGVWWLGAPTSPLGVVAAHPSRFYPLVTAGLALLTALAWLWRPSGPGASRWQWLEVRGGRGRGVLAKYATAAALALAELALLMTRAELCGVTALTLWLAAGTGAVLCVILPWMVPTGGVLWVAGCMVAAIAGATDLGVAGPATRMLAAAVGAILAAFVLLGLSARVRLSVPVSVTLEPGAKAATRRRVRAA
jgi:hypothetical protein